MRLIWLVTLCSDVQECVEMWALSLLGGKLLRTRVIMMLFDSLSMNRDEQNEQHTARFIAEILGRYLLLV